MQNYNCTIIPIMQRHNLWEDGIYARNENSIIQLMQIHNFKLPPLSPTSLNLFINIYSIIFFQFPYYPHFLNKC